MSLDLDNLHKEPGWWVGVLSAVITSFSGSVMVMFPILSRSYKGIKCTGNIKKKEKSGCVK